MAKLFIKQAGLYAEARPSYPPELFLFIASNTPNRGLAWDVGTGNGQAAVSLAGLYRNVVATDTSPTQLALAHRLPNIRYQLTPPSMSLDELAQLVAPQSSVDLVTAAQAIHWFDLPTFYKQVKHVLRRPGGVLAVWCYTKSYVDDAVDAVFHRVFERSIHFSPPECKLISDHYVNMDFPFDPIDGGENTGPFTFESVVLMDLEMYLTYIRSWSIYQNAYQKGVDLLNKQVVRDFEKAWGVNEIKPVRFPLHLRIGRVGGKNF
ncbi:unnamed protein product [Victoria cruziana]